MTAAEDHRSNGDRFLDCYWNEGSIVALGDAVAQYRLALERTEEGSEERVRAQMALANGLRIQFEDGLGEKEVFQEALALAEASVSGTDFGPLLFIEASITLSRVLMRRQRPVDEPTLRRSVQIASRAAEMADRTAYVPSATAYLQYAFSLIRLHDLDRDDDIVARANALVDRLLLVDDWFMIPEAATTCALARYKRFNLTDQTKDINDAIDFTRHIISVLPKKHPHLCHYFANLGLMLETRYDSSGDPSDWASAQSAATQASKRVPKHSPTWHIIQGNYAGQLQQQFQLRSNLEDLDESIAVIREVIAHIQLSSATGIPRFADFYMASSGKIFREAYAQYGRLEFLDEAIAVLVKNLHLVPQERKWMAFHSLGSSYFRRFAAHGRISDLENATSLFKQALSQAVRDKGKQCAYALADCLLVLYEVEANSRFLEESVGILRELVHENQARFYAEAGPMRCSLLGKALLLRYIRNGASQDLEDSLFIQEESLRSLAPENVLYPIAQARLGVVKYQLGVKHDDLGALHSSVTAFNSSTLR